MVCMLSKTWYLYQRQIKPFELVVTAPENHFEKCSNDPFERARSNCSGAEGGQMEISRDQRWRMGGGLAAPLVYRKLLYEEPSQPVVKPRLMETDEERGSIPADSYFLSL